MRFYCCHSSTSLGSVRLLALGDHSFMLRICQGPTVPLLHLVDYFELQNVLVTRPYLLTFLSRVMLTSLKDHM